MFKTNVADVKARLSEYLERAAQGERILICRHNKPVAELRGVEQLRTEPRPIGPLPGRPVFQIPPSFFEALPEDELELWEKGDPLLQSPDPAGRRASRAAEAKPPYSARGRSGARRRRLKS